MFFVLMQILKGKKEDKDEMRKFYQSLFPYKSPFEL